MVQKYGACIEVGVVKIVAYSRANQWHFFYLVVFSFSFLGSASQFTNVPLGKRTVWASICSFSPLSSSPLSILTRILSRRECARSFSLILPLMLKPAFWLPGHFVNIPHGFVLRSFRFSRFTSFELVDFARSSWTIELSILNISRHASAIPKLLLHDSATVHHDRINGIDFTHHRFHTFHASCHEREKKKEGGAEKRIRRIPERVLFSISPAPFSLDSRKINAAFLLRISRIKRASERKGKVKYTFLRVRA